MFYTEFYPCYNYFLYVHVILESLRIFSVYSHVDMLLLSFSEKGIGHTQHYISFSPYNSRAIGPVV